MASLEKSQVTANITDAKMKKGGETNSWPVSRQRNHQEPADHLLFGQSCQSDVGETAA